MLFFLSFSFIIGYTQNIESINKIKDIKKNKPFTIHGNLGFGLSAYHTNMNNNRMAPFNWFLTGAPVFSIYGFQIPITLMYSETGRSLTHPFVYNFYGASPYYKWAKAHFGFRTMSFTDYTMNGMLFNGVGIELNPKKLRFGAFYGVLNPAVAEDTNSGQFGVVLPAYKRTAMGMKIGVGSSQSFIDFSFFKGNDVQNSLSQIPLEKTIRPSDNIGFGTKFRLKLLKNWFVEADGGVSVFTKNKLQDTLKGVKELEDYRNIFVVNSSTSAYYAGHIMLGCQYNNWGLVLQAKEVSSDFKSMGLYFVQNDIREFTATPNIRLFKGKINITNTTGFYLDNISDKRANQTIRKILNFNMNFIPNNKLNIGVGYNNFGVSRNNGFVQQNDSLLFSLINQSFNTNISYFLSQNKNKVKVLNFFANYLNSDDRNEFTKKFNNSMTYNGVVSYSYNHNIRKWGIQSSINYSNFSTFNNQFQIYGPSVSLNKSSLKDKYRVGVNFGYSERYKNNEKQGQIFNCSMNASFKFYKKHQIQVLANLLQNSTGVISNQLISEQRVSLKYNFNF